MQSPYKNGIILFQLNLHQLVLLLQQRMTRLAKKRKLRPKFRHRHKDLPQQEKPTSAELPKRWNPHHRKRQREEMRSKRRERSQTVVMKTIKISHVIKAATMPKIPIMTRKWLKMKCSRSWWWTVLLLMNTVTAAGISEWWGDYWRKSGGQHD